VQDNFALSDDQIMIRDTAEEFLAEVSSSVAVRSAMEVGTGFDAGTWSRIGRDMGWCGIQVPETYGGLGLSWVELTVLLEQMGRRLLCSPFFSSVCLAATALIETANEAGRAAYLPGIAAGSLTATLGFGSQGIEWNPDAVTAKARRTPEGFVLNGSFRHVVDGATAELLLLTAKLDGEVALFAVPRSGVGVTSEVHACIDRTRRVAWVALNGAVVAGDALLARGDQACEGLSRTSALAAIALAAEQLGGAQQCLDLTLQYTSGRVQFGRTINSFQAVKHRCAQMMVMIEATRSALIGAAHRVSAGAATKDLLLEAACVKTFASEAFYFCAAEAIQLHGGVGFTWDYDPHLYFKRAQMSGHWLGSTDTMRERAAAALLDGT